MSDRSRLTSSDGTSINVRRLAQTVFVAIAGAFAGGFADTIGAYIDAFFVDPIQGVGGFLSELVSAPFTVLTNAVYGTSAGAESFVGQFGLLAPLLGVGIALLTYYLFTKVMQYAG